jgi:hypothetical protein
MEPMFITVFTPAVYWSLSQANSLQSTPVIYNKIPYLLLNLEVLYHLHTNCPLIPILSQFSSVHTSDLQQNSIILTHKDQTGAELSHILDY